MQSPPSHPRCAPAISSTSSLPGCTFPYVPPLSISHDHDGSSSVTYLIKPFPSVTTACVYGSSVDATKLGFGVTVISDGVETTTAEAQATALEELETWWGVTVETLADFEGSE